MFTRKVVCGFCRGAAGHAPQAGGGLAGAGIDGLMLCCPVCEDPRLCRELLRTNALNAFNFYTFCSPSYRSGGAMPCAS